MKNNHEQKINQNLNVVFKIVFNIDVTKYLGGRERICYDDDSYQRFSRGAMEGLFDGYL